MYRENFIETKKWLMGIVVISSPRIEKIILMCICDSKRFVCVLLTFNLLVIFQAILFILAKIVISPSCFSIKS